MRCFICGAEKVVRLGKYGPFWACPNSRPGNSHGTTSVTKNGGYNGNKRAYENNTNSTRHHGTGRCPYCGDKHGQSFGTGDCGCDPGYDDRSNNGWL